MSKIPSFVWIILVIVLGVGFLAFLNSKKNTNIDVTNQTLPVQVEVYSDYNCPHCADFEPFVKEVAETYGDKVNVQNKQLPFLAATSTTYAYAAEAARLQDKFQEYHENLFKWNSFKRDPSNTTFEYTDEDKAFFAQDVDSVKLAERLGLDIDKFQTDMNSDQVKNLVSQQKSDIVKLTGTQSTPTVVIYGKVFSMTTFTDLKTKVGELIQQIESATNK